MGAWGAGFDNDSHLSIVGGLVVPPIDRTSQTHRGGGWLGTSQEIGDTTKQVNLGGVAVGRIGLGAMGMSAAYTGAGTDDTESIRKIRRAIDLYYQHRVDPETPIEEVVGTLGEPVAEDGVLAVLRELGIGFVPYSPLGHGFLTGQIRSMADLDDGDRREARPRPACGLSRLLAEIRPVVSGCECFEIVSGWVEEVHATPTVVGVDLAWMSPLGVCPEVPTPLV